MLEFKSINNADKSTLYRELIAQASALLDGEKDLVARAANFSSLLYHSLPEVNWVGFYFMQQGELVVGPFQGKPACVRITLGKGVCGTAAQQCKTILVPNVHEFPGHIACDEASQSEIVLPLLKADTLIGVLDLDSSKLARFDETDKAGLERLARVFIGQGGD